MEQAIEAVRGFNRFFTQHVGATRDRFLDTDATLPEARLLFEVATREPVPASTLGEALRLDRGYLSRTVARLERRGWIARERAARDARSRPIRLTAAGRDAFRVIDERQRAAVAAGLARLDPAERDELVRALATVRLLLDPPGGGDVVLRTFRTGDAGRIAARQAELYAASHNWGRALEGVVADTVAAFLRDFQPDREQCWVAEIDGAMAGAVFLSDEGGGTARLRLLHVEPFARRRGIGDALVTRCVDFARERGYAEIVLWTHTVLEAARRLYGRHGFERVATAVHRAFGEPVEGETWRKRLVPEPDQPTAPGPDAARAEEDGPRPG